ncbi:MAG: T9SS type A sorting domain-containing protein, partial [Nonlabens sp.]
FDYIKIFKHGYTYSWSNNETTGVVQNLQPGNYTVVVTTPDGCQVTRNVTISGTPLDDASFSYASTDFCATDAPATPTITGLSGGFFFTNTFGLDLNNVTGEINFANSQPGRTYDINYQTSGPCPNISTVSITINFSEDANFGYNANSFSTSDPIQFPFFINTTGGTFSSSPNGLSIDPVSGGIDPTTSAIGSYTVTYITAGACPGTSSQTFTINNTDNIAPVARCQDFSGNLDANGLLTIQAFNIDAGSSDDVGVASLTASQTVFSCADLGDNTVTLTVTDTSGNQDTCTATVTVNDVDAPVINCADVTLELDANGQASLDSLYNTGDTYDVTATSFNQEVLSTPNFISLGDDQVAIGQNLGFDFTFFGNSYNTFNISSNGFITFGSNTNSGCCNGLPLDNGNVNPNNMIALGWTDLNPGRINNISYETLGVAPNRRLIVEYNNVPFFGGGTSVTGQIKLFEISNRVEIHTLDIVSTGRSITQGISNDDGSIGYPVPGRNGVSWTATNDAWSFTPASVYAIDNCAAPTVTVSQTDFTCADLGPNIINISAVDASGNSANCTFFVTVVDNQNPEPINAVLPDIIANCSVTSLTPPLVSDNCADPVQITNNASLPITTQGTTVVTWIYNDGNGNFNFQNQNVIITDTTPPVPDSAILPDVIAECSITSLTPPTATEASCNNGDVTINGTTTQTLPITTSGTTVITWTYEDANGNISTQDQNVLINDTVAPTPDIANLPDLVSQCEITSITPPTATDNCAGNVLVTGNASLPLTTSGQITWTYDDGSGNTSSQTQNVIISDTTPPVPDSATLTDITSNCEVTNLTAPTATDNCASAVQVSSDAVLPITAQGTTVVTWTYTDVNNNSVTQLQNVIVDDSIAPVPDANSLSDQISDCSVSNITPPTATDNCNGSITGVSDVSFPLSSQGTTVVTWTYDDGNGNISTQTQNVIISDTEAPVPDVVSLIDITEQCAVSTLTAPTALDNCTGALTATTDVVLPITGGTTQVIWTYDDGNGNVATQTQNVTVSDNTVPVPDVASLSDVNSQCEVSTLNIPTATDNCLGAITATSDASFPITSGTTIVTWTYDDGNGNVVTQTQNVTVADTTAPVPDLATLPDFNDFCEATSLPAPTATDNCIGSVTATSDATFPIGLGTTVVTWTYDDGNGNTVTQTQNVVVTDTDAPVADCPTDVQIAVASGTTTYDLLDYTTALNATDGCTTSTSSLTVIQTPAVGTTVSAPSTTPVTITITDDSGNDTICTFNVQVDVTASIGGPEKVDIKIDLYPNPTSDVLNISAPGEVIKSISLVDLRGRLVNEWNDTNSDTARINLASYESAIYFVRVETERGTVNKRIVKN